MCDLYAGQNPELYESIKRSVRLHGHVTSVCLERQFWEILDRLAAGEGMSTPQFVSRLYDEVVQRHGEAKNFASLLRVACTVYLRQPDGSAAQQQHADPVTVASTH